MKYYNIIAVTLVLCVLLSCFAVPSSVHAEALNDADSVKGEIIKDATDYLSSSINSNSSYGYDGLINDTAECCAILGSYSDTNVSESLSWLNSFNKTNNDEISRAVMADGNKDALSAVFKSQNSDGGYGLTAEYESDVFDSILVLEAINSLGQKDRSNSTWRLVTYIARQINKNSSYSINNNSDENVIITSMALYTVSKYMKDNSIKSDLTTDMMNKAASYLQKNSSNIFSQNEIEKSLFINLALQEAGLFDLQEETIYELKKVQKDDGSFYNDVHLTSLVVWLLGKMNDISTVNIYDLQTSNTSQAYYGVDTNINVSYAISYDANIDKDYKIKCSITNGSELIYESEEEEITLTKGQNLKSGTFKYSGFNQNKDSGIKVVVTLLDGDVVVKKSEGEIVMENMPRAGETEITDCVIELSDYYAFADSPTEIVATYKLLYVTNVDNEVEMDVTLSKNGNILSEELYNEKLTPDSDYVTREALNFTPEEEGKYIISVKCIYQGNQLFETTSDVNVIKVPSKEYGTETDAHTVTDAIWHVPFTVSWIGPKLSDYMVYVGNKQNITGDIGIICYGDDDFSGKVVVKVTYGAEEASVVEKEVTISAGERNVNISDIVNFEASNLGDYTVTATLFDSEGQEVIKGSKTVKVIEKKKIDFIANSKISDSEERTIDISWNDISDSQNTYNYRLYRRHDELDWEPRSIWNEKERVKVLNVYPNIPLLKKWMTTTISDSEYPAGMGMFDIESVHYRDFNADPEKYMLENNKWKYDVVFFGSWDCGFDLSQKGYEATQEYINSGRGVLFGHDTLWLAAGHSQFNKFADQIGILLKGGPAAEYSGSTASVLKIGTLTNFPWTIRGTLKIPTTHTSGQYAGGTLEGTEWMCIDSRQVIDEATQAHSNFYLVTNNNVGMIQTGHSSGQASDDERKVIANTLFYLHQISQITTAKDNSFYDLAAPDSPDVKFVSIDGENITFDVSSKDNGTKYQYYIAAMSSADKDSDGINSNIMTHTALSGLKGYVYAVNGNPDEDKTVLEYDENGEIILNVVDSDENGNLRIDIDISAYDSDSYLHIYAVDNENNVSGEVIKNLGDGKLSPDIDTDKETYNKGETAKISSLTSVMPVNAVGDVSISLYDSEDRFIEELFSENNQKVTVDEPYTVETELDLDDTFDGDYQVKIEWDVADGQTYSDTADFTVGMPKIPDLHTGTDAEKTPDITGKTNVRVSKTDSDESSYSVKTTSTPDKTVDAKTDKDKNKKNPKDTVNPSDNDLDTSTTTQTTENTTEITTETTTSTEALTDTPQADPTKNESRTPSTGDEMDKVLVVLLMSIAAGVILIFIKKKRDNYVQH